MGVKLPGHTQVPNDIIDTAMRDMSDQELRVVLVVIRKILGWSKKSPLRKEPISQSQFVEMTGMCRNSVKKGIQEAEEHGWIECVDNNGPNGTARYIVVFDDEETIEDGHAVTIEGSCHDQADGHAVTPQKKGKKSSKDISHPADEQQVSFPDYFTTDSNRETSPKGKELVDHPMAKEVIKAFKLKEGKPLPKNAIAEFSRPCYSASADSKFGIAEYGVMTYHYDNTPGFDTFFEERLSMWMNAERTKKSPRDFLAHIRNFGKEEGWVGWLTWKEKHVSETTPIEKDAPTTMSVVDTDSFNW